MKEFNQQITAPVIVVTGTLAVMTAEAAVVVTAPVVVPETPFLPAIIRACLSIK